MLDFDKITVCVDMAGCPNRCRHCWLGVTDNKGVSIEQLRKMANDFREQAKHFEILSWYREPDFEEIIKACESWKNSYLLKKHHILNWQAFGV